MSNNIFKWKIIWFFLHYSHTWFVYTKLCLHPQQIIPGVKLSARPLALATISLVWAHEIIKAFAHLATVNLLSCKHFISSFNLNTLTYIVDPIYLNALFRQHWFCTRPGGKLTTWVEKFKCLDIELSINSGVNVGKKIYRVWRNFKLSMKWKVYVDFSYSHWHHILWFSTV